MIDEVYGFYIDGIKDALLYAITLGVTFKLARASIDHSEHVTASLS
jgi:hypothetical protein